MALRFLIRTYFPLSRMWAAAEAAEEDVAAFAEEVPLTLPRGATLERLQGVLIETAERRAHAVAAEREWQDAFFTPGAVGDLDAVERQRQRAMSRYMATRWEFRFLRRKAPPVRFAPAGPERAEARFGRFRDNPSALFTAPSKPAIRQSRAITRGGITHRWLKFETPFADLSDTVWAHVYEPEGGFDHTVVMCHGLSIEADMWSGSLEMAAHFVDRRIRIIEPEAPWHGRRRPHGVYGGELFVAQGPFGAIEQFAAHVSEIACLVRWARETGPGRVGIGGISLGALNSQLAVAHAREWPADMSPDAALLITTTDRLDEVAWFGGFAVGFGTARAYAEAGWNHDHLVGWQSLSAPVGEPGIDPGRIVVMLGRHDSVMPFEGARAFVERWRIPDANLFVKRRGHFTVPLGLARDRRPVERYLAVLAS